MGPDTSLRRVAERRDGIITGEELRSCGLSETQVHVRKKNGDLVKVLPGVFRLGGVPDTYRSRLTAVARWLGETGHFNGVTAGHILRLDGIDQPKRIGVARYSLPRVPPWLVVRRLQPNDRPAIRRLNGFRIPHVERVLAECAADLPSRTLALVLDDALRRRLTTLDRMWAFLDGWKHGRRGATALRKLMTDRDDRDERVRSKFETKMLAILRSLKDHRFDADFEVVAGGDRYVLDFFCPAARLAIECHSLTWHMGKHNSDAERDRLIRAEDIDIIYFTWDDIRLRPGRVKRDILKAIARRTPHLFH